MLHHLSGLLERAFYAQVTGTKPLQVQVIDGELHVRPRRDVLKRIHAVLRPYAPATGSVADELIADRRVEAARD